MNRPIVTLLGLVGVSALVGCASLRGAPAEIPLNAPSPSYKEQVVHGRRVVLVTVVDRREMKSVMVGGSRDEYRVPTSSDIPSVFREVFEGALRAAGFEVLGAGSGGGDLRLHLTVVRAWAENPGGGGKVKGEVVVRVTSEVGSAKFERTFVSHTGNLVDFGVTGILESAIVDTANQTAAACVDLSNRELGRGI